MLSLMSKRGEQKQGHIWALLETSLNILMRWWLEGKGIRLLKDGLSTLLDLHVWLINSDINMYELTHFVYVTWLQITNPVQSDKYSGLFFKQALKSGKNNLISFAAVTKDNKYINKQLYNNTVHVVCFGFLQFWEKNLRM